MEGEEPIFDPLDSDTGSNTDNNDDVQDENIDRLDNTDWCLCTECIHMPTEVECRCCKEGDFIQLKINDMFAEHLLPHTDVCICTSERFRTLCLDKDVLEIALIQMHTALRKGPVPNPLTNR